MKIFLLVVAGVFVGLILFLYVGLWIVKRKIKSVFGDLGEQLQGLVDGVASLPQFELELAPAENVAWAHPEEIAQSVDLLADQGFSEVGRYLPNGIDTIIMGLFHNLQENLVVVIYDGASMDGPRIDVCADYGDGGQIFVSNVKHDGLEKPEWTTYHRHQDLDNAALLETALSELPPEGRVSHSAQSIPDRIIETYNREQTWRAARGGYTDEEVRSSIVASGNEPTPETMEMSKAMLNSTLKDGIETKLHETLLSTTTMSAAEWEAVEDYLAMLHPMSDADSICNHFDTLYEWNDGCDEDDEDDDDQEDTGARTELLNQIQELLKTHSPNEAFTQLAAEAPRYAELKHLGHVDEPVPADFYALPPWRDDEG